MTKKTMSEGKTLEEANNINKSLMVLGSTSLYMCVCVCVCVFNFHALELHKIYFIVDGVDAPHRQRISIYYTNNL
jgi:hypothetical protein